MAKNKKAANFVHLLSLASFVLDSFLPKNVSDEPPPMAEVSPWSLLSCIKTTTIIIRHDIRRSTPNINSTVPIIKPP